VYEHHLPEMPVVSRGATAPSAAGGV